jgi:hypothetical protein
VDEDLEHAAHLRRLIALTLRLNEGLLTKLSTLVEALEGDRPLNKAEHEDLRTAYKQIATVIDFENQLIKHGTAGTTGAGETLDLNAARAEVARRLDRLGATAQTGGAA